MKKNTLIARIILVVITVLGMLGFTISGVYADDSPTSAERAPQEEPLSLAQLEDVVAQYPGIEIDSSAIGLLPTETEVREDIAKLLEFRARLIPLQSPEPSSPQTPYSGDGDDDSIIEEVARTCSKSVDIWGTIEHHLRMYRDTELHRFVYNMELISHTWTWERAKGNGGFYANVSSVVLSDEGPLNAGRKWKSTATFALTMYTPGGHLHLTLNNLKNRCYVRA